MARELNREAVPAFLLYGTLAARVMKSMEIQEKPKRLPRWGDQIRMLLTYLRPQRRRVGLLALLLLGSIGLQLFNPQILRRFLDSARQGAGNETLAIAAVLFLLIAL